MSTIINPHPLPVNTGDDEKNQGVSTLEVMLLAVYNNGSSVLTP